MRLLLINTCGLEGVVALAGGDAEIVVETLPGRGSSEHLMPAIRRLFQPAGGGIAGLTAIAVVNGPGSFTGVRAGLSAAKGLCEAGAVPLIALSRLELVAASIPPEPPEAPSPAVALLDAGRGEYYCGVYRNGLRVAENMTGIDQVAQRLAQGRGVTCEQRVAQRLAQIPGTVVRLVAEPGPELMLKLALQRIDANAWSDVATVDANYLRRTDAELLMSSKDRVPPAQANESAT